MAPRRHRRVPWADPAELLSLTASLPLDQSALPTLGRWATSQACPLSIQATHDLLSSLPSPPHSSSSLLLTSPLLLSTSPPATSSSLSAPSSAAAVSALSSASPASSAAAVSAASPASPASPVPGSTDSESSGVHSQRLQMAMALTRFVNGQLDPLQTGQTARSIGSLAERIGLPHALVQIRHQATHEHLPSWATLHAALLHALAWLHTNFWYPLHDIFSSSPHLQNTTSSNPQAILRKYKSGRKAVLRSEPVQPPDLPRSYPDDLLHALAAVPFLVPTAHAKRPSDLVLPQALKEIWGPLIADLARDPRTLSRLLLHLRRAIQLAVDDRSVQITLLAWTKLLSGHVLQGLPKYPEDLQQAFLAAHACQSFLPSAMQWAEELAVQYPFLADLDLQKDSSLAFSRPQPLISIQTGSVEPLNDLQTMQRRLQLLRQGQTAPSTASEHRAVIDLPMAPVDLSHEAEDTGWPKVSDAWRPVPFGVWA